MKAVRMLKRSALIGLTITALTFGSAFVHPTATASAATLPGSDTGSPDIGYPSCGPWRGFGVACGTQAIRPGSDTSSPDIGYPTMGPWRGCGAACGTQAIRPEPDIGYPSMGPWRCGGACGSQAARPDPGSGYPTCGSLCRTSGQPSNQDTDDSAWN